MYIIGIMATFIMFVLSTPLVESKNALLQLAGKTIVLLIFFLVGLFIFRYPDAGYKVYMELYGERAKLYYQCSDHIERLIKVFGFVFMLLSVILMIIIIADYMLSSLK